MSLGLHLRFQVAVGVFDLRAAVQKSTIGLLCQAVPLMFGNRKIQRSLNRFGLGPGPESFLRTLDLADIKLEMFVNFGCRSGQVCPHVTGMMFTAGR